MSSFEKAVRKNIKLVIGLSSPTGGGKTYTALEFGRGLAGPEGRVVLIDTENGRGSHYADQFDYDICELKSPFRPLAYLAKIQEADRAGYDVVIVDSMSHEWAGVGGVLDYHDEEVDRMAGPDANWARKEALKMAGWIKPKAEHRKMVDGLLMLRCHVILCFRTKDSIEMVKDASGKTVIIKKKTGSGFEGLLPITDANLPYELTVSLTMQAGDGREGEPIWIKVQEQHRKMFPKDRPISRESGAMMREWAEGGVAVEKIGEADLSQVLDLIDSREDPAAVRKAVLEFAKVKVIDDIPALLVPRVLKRLQPGDAK